VFIAPVARFLPNGRMVDPRSASFYVSWQNYDDERQQAELIEDAGEIAGADAAIAWGRARCDRVLIRLGHVEETHFSAGRITLQPTDGSGRRPYPSWPPSGPPSEGWWTPSDETQAENEAMRPSPHTRPGVAEPELRNRPPGPWTTCRNPSSNQRPQDRFRQASSPNAGAVGRRRDGHSRSIVRLVTVFGPHTVFWHIVGLLVLLGLLLGAVIDGSEWATVIFAVGVSLQATILVLLVGRKRQKRRRLAER
jgi:hypothetical protein